MMSVSEMSTTYTQKPNASALHICKRKTDKKATRPFMLPLVCRIRPSPNPPPLGDRNLDRNPAMKPSELFQQWSKAVGARRAYRETQSGGLCSHRQVLRQYKDVAVRAHGRKAGLLQRQQPVCCATTWRHCPGRQYNLQTIKGNQLRTGLGILEADSVRTEVPAFPEDMESLSSTL